MLSLITLWVLGSTFFWSKVDLNRVAKLCFESKKYTFKIFNIFDFQISTYLNHLFYTFVHRFCSIWKLQWFLHGSEAFKVVLFLSIIDFEPTDLRLSDRTDYKSARRRRAGCFCTRSNALRWLSVAAKEYPTVSGSVAKRPRSLRSLQERKLSVLIIMIVIFRLRADGERCQNCISLHRSIALREDSMYKPSRKATLESFTCGKNCQNGVRTSE